MNAQRFKTERASEWRRVGALAARAEKSRFRGLDKATLDELTLGYRRMTSDLALVQARFPESQLGADLERVVARLHNVIYRGRQHRWRDVRTSLIAEIPRTVRARWRYVAVASALLFVPALVAYGVGLARPELARAFMPARIQEAAEAGRVHTDGLLEMMPSSWLSSAIATNNIAVVFSTFALGLLAGVGTIFSLGFNGIQLGLVLAFYQDHHLAGRMLAFIVGHGVTELSAICLAGAAGLLLGDALIAPGWSSRGAALAANGRDAVRIVTGLIPTLALAGLIEGFVSPSPAYPVSAKVILGVSLGLTLWLWLGVGGSGADRALGPSKAR
ncbi:MAG: stage II sporulation protein M [Deltaproteobacteria bacterium]|nr:stage II sporulation protein M [Deltaproteobacteria bacterium]